MTKLLCKKCGHLWVPYRPNPKACPRCKRYDWREERIRQRYAINKPQLGAIDVNDKPPV